MFDYTYRKNIIYIIYSMHTYTSIFKKNIYVRTHIKHVYKYDDGYKPYF